MQRKSTLRSLCYIVICWFKQNKSQRHNNKTQEDFFNKIFTSHFICKGTKRLLKGCVWEGAGDRTETAIFWPPLLWPSTLCLSRSPGLLNRRPSDPLCWMMAFFTASYQHLLWTPIPQGPKPLRPGVAFPTTSHSNWHWNSTGLELNWVI